VLEVTAVWGLIVLLIANNRAWFPAFAEWQDATFGFQMVGRALYFMVVPLAILAVTRRILGRYGLSFNHVWPSFGLTFQAFAIVGPASMAFWLVAWLGFTVRDWGGAAVLLVVEAAVLGLVILVTRNLSTRDETAGSWWRLAGFAAVIGLGLAVAAATHERVPFVPAVLNYLLFVGFGEELFFRGYVQSRLNQAFGRPFAVAGVSFGWGVAVAAVLFGLIHAFTADPFSLPWAAWTAVSGLTYGFLREKDGSFLACALLHGLADLPLAFLGG